MLLSLLAEHILSEAPSADNELISSGWAVHAIETAFAVVPLFIIAIVQAVRNRSLTARLQVMGLELYPLHTYPLYQVGTTCTDSFFSLYCLWCQAVIRSHPQACLFSEKNSGIPSTAAESSLSLSPFSCSQQPPGVVRLCILNFRQVSELFTFLPQVSSLLKAAGTDQR